MNERIKSNFLEKVREGDVVYYLGDLAMNKKGEWFKRYCLQYFPNVPAEMIFLYGNHDRMKPSEYEEIGFKEVTRDPIGLYLRGTNLLLTHEPTEEDSDEVVNIHGHVHDKWKTTFLTGKKTLAVNVSVEMWDYYPVSEDQIFGEIEKARGYAT
jgi:calcineurin-like phosphoesterase family protein